MCLKSTREAIHFEVYSVKILNKKNMSSQFLLDEQAKKKHENGKLKNAGLGNVLSTLFYFSLLNYGSPWHHNLLCLHGTKKKEDTLQPAEKWMFSQILQEGSGYRTSRN